MLPFLYYSLQKLHKSNCRMLLSRLLSVCSKVKNGKLYLATLCSVLGPLSFGFVLGYSSPAIPELMKISNPHLRLNDDQASWFGVQYPS